MAIECSRTTQKTLTYLATVNNVVNVDLLSDGDSFAEAAQLVHQTPIERLSARPNATFRHLENLFRTAKHAAKCVTTLPRCCSAAVVLVSVLVSVVPEAYLAVHTESNSYYRSPVHPIPRPHHRLTFTRQN